MSNKNGETWLCPTCSLARFPYGEACPTWATGCENMRTPNINGEIYLRKHADWQPLNMRELAAISIGIGAISDEDAKASKHDE